jgi:hypothetical protein
VNIIRCNSKHVSSVPNIATWNDYSFAHAIENDELSARKTKHLVFFWGLLLVSWMKRIPF